MKLGRESGATLLSILLIIMFMAISAMGATQHLTRAAMISKSSDARSSAFWAIRGGMDAGAILVARNLDQLEGKLTLRSPIFQHVIRVPTERGVLIATFSDASNCFNLNAMLNPGDGSIRLGELAQYERLLVLTGIPNLEAESMANSLADWLDADSRPRRSGAETDSYRPESVSHRMMNTRLYNLNDLYEIANYSDDNISRIAKFVCVRQPGYQQPLNINTLEPDQSALLTALYAEELDPDTARQVLQARPANGWTDALAFFDEPDIASLSGVAMNDRVISIISHHVSARMTVTAGEMTRSVAVLYGPGSDDPIEALRILSALESDK